MKGFLAGLASGVVLMAGIWAAKGTGTGGPAAPPPGPPTGLSTGAKDRIERIERDLESSKSQTAAALRRAEDAEARVAKLEAEARSAKDPAARSSTSPSPAPAEADAQRTARLEMFRRRAQVEAGKPLPDELAKFLELEPAQLETLNQMLVAEGKELYGVLRQVAADQPDVAIPKDDNVGVLLAALGSSLKDAQGLNKHFEDPEILMGTKTLHLDEIMDPSSPFIRIMEGLDAVRARTLETMSRSLRPDQRERVEALLRRAFNFGGGSMSLPENFVLRRVR